MSRADELATMSIIDTHQHLWDLKQFKLPWVKADSPLAKNFVTT